MEQHAAHVIELMALGGNLAQKVERALWESMKDGDLSLARVAAELKMSPLPCSVDSGPKGPRFTT